MRCLPLAAAVLLALSAGASVARPDAVPNASTASETRSIWIVRFAEPALAAYRGDKLDAFAKLAGLAATSPSATGPRKLDMKSAASQAYLGKLAQLRDARLASASSLFGRSLEPMFVYDVAFNGVALELSAREAAQLRGVEGIAQIERDTLRKPQTDAGPRWIHADSIWTAPAPQGNRGEGIVVGVIDTGINRTHPSFAGVGPVDGFAHSNPRGTFLGECATNTALCTNKLIGIRDFSICTGANNASSECDDREANDGSDVDGHGSHVASTVAGNTLNATLTFAAGTAPTTRPISGVAPHANLVMYKACEEEETCRGSWLVAAVNAAAADGVDVINYSIGGAPFSPWQDSVALAMLGAREGGTVVVAAAGNDGPNPGTVSSSSNAPWVISVANASHDRAIVNRVVDLAGGATAPPSGGVLLGAGATAGVGPAPIVYAGNFGSALCATGSDVGALPPATTTNPWPTPVFNGQIVVCDRGIYARVIKGQNVKKAGGAGMILANGPAEGENVVGDEHVLPASNISYNDGVALKAWLASGSGHTGRLEGGSVQSLPQLADILASNSGRGPVTPFGTLKPNVTAPGTNILAAAGTGNFYAFLSGTSMASPHVAGAAALLLGAHPGWGPSEVETALGTTARPSVRLPDGVTPAGVFDQGAGVVDLTQAVRSGLSFPVNRAAFIAANQPNGRIPSSLNLPSLVDSACFDSCSFQRQVKALGAGTWKATVAIDGAEVIVTPAQFTLADNATQNLTINVTPGAAGLGTTLEGAVSFTRTDNGAAVTRLPLAIFVSAGSAPDTVDISTPDEAGFRDIAISELIGLPSARFAGTELVQPTRATLSLKQDDSSDDPYNFLLPNDAGKKWLLLPVGSAGPARVIAATSSATAPDVDLYVGLDSDGDGLPEATELLCRSAGPSANERCEASATVTAGQRFWVLPQNYPDDDDTTPLTTDAVDVEAAAISLNPVNGALVATGPGHTETSQDFSIRAIWNVPDLLPGASRWGYVLAGADANRPTAAAQILVKIMRDASATSAPQVLVPGATRTLALAAGQAQDRLYLDVPPNATGLSVSTSGTGEVDLYVARADGASSPQIDPAPARSAAAANSVHPGAAETITVNGATLAPGRWYVTPVNAGTVPARIDLTTQLTYGAPRPQPGFGPYYNPARSGAGLFLFPVGNAWGLAWYTYLQDGSPTWYLGVLDAPAANQGVWSVTLLRQAWDGATSTGTAVGTGQLAFTATGSFEFSWNLDGESGHEPMVFIDSGGCPLLGNRKASLSGLWYSPTQSGYGYSITAFPTLESVGAYFYDDLGLARWAIGSRSPVQTGEHTMDLLQQQGFCPLCSHVPPVASNVGTLTRTYTDDDSGRIAVDLDLVAPISGTWSVDLPVSKLSNALICP